jgi:hypothetical protein
MQLLQVGPEVWFDVPVKSPALLAVLAGLLAGADHVDSPRVLDDPAVDLTDLYAWMSPDATKVRLALAIPAAQFSPGLQYVFHVNELPIICVFDAEQNVTCWAGDRDRASGDAHTENGITSASGMLRVFTGLREDAFYFNAAGFSAAISAVRSAAPGLTFDPAGCPNLDAPTATALATQLRTAPFGAPPYDLFVGSVSALVVEIDKSLVTGNGPVISVWASVRS